MVSDHREGTAAQAEVEAPTPGFFPTLIATIFGTRVKRLAEETNRAHLLSYLLIIAQSVTTVLVFGLTEVTLVLHSSLAIRVGAAMFLFVLAVTVLASDIALLETMQRIPALARNRQSAQMSEHVAYVVFVLLVEGATYAVALWALDSDAQLLTSGRPLIPAKGWAFVLMIVLRVTLISWSAVQLIIVRTKLPVLLSTLMNTGKEIVGAHVERQLAGLNISHLPVQATFGVYAKMAQPPRPIGGFWNAVTGGWVVRHALAQEAEEERQARNVRDALETFHAIPPRATTTQAATSPRLPALPSSNGQNGQNGKLNNREKRAMLAASMYSGHPTSPRDNEYPLDGGDEDADWATSGSFGADDFGAFGDDGPKFHMNQRSSRGERAQAAHIAPRGAELAVREFVMPDLPASKYEREDDTEQRRAVFRVLDDALANDKSLSRLEVAKLAGVSENTVRSARAIWETLRAADKKRKKAAPKTREMPAVTSDMLTDALTTR